MFSDTSVSTKFNASETGPTEHVVVTVYNTKDIELLFKLKETNPEDEFLIYGPDEKPKGFDGSIMLIFGMAVFTVAAGSLWSGYTKQQMYVFGDT